MPARRSDNDKRRLLSEPALGYIEDLRREVRYKGSPKHKLTPHLYRLTPFRGNRGDATLCDRDAGFELNDMNSISDMLNRGLNAGLVGENGILWAIADDGWIYEARITIPGQMEYHGYPVRASEAIAEPVYERFRKWAENQGDQQARQVAANCKHLYGFK